MGTKTEVKHTPGPWTIYEEYECIPDNVDENSLAAEEYCVARGIRGGDGKGLNHGEDCERFLKADARLIAAAPELLVALKAIEPHALGHNKPNCKGKARDPENCDVCRAIWAARDAIAKAEGR